MRLHLRYVGPALHTVFSDSRPRRQGPKALECLAFVTRCTYAVAYPPSVRLLTHEQKVQQPNMLCTLIHCCFIKIRLPLVVGMQGVDCDDMHSS